MQRWSMMAVVAAVACSLAACAVSEDVVTTSEPDPADDAARERARDPSALDDALLAELPDDAITGYFNECHDYSAVCPPGGTVVYTSGLWGCGDPFCGGSCAHGAAIGIRQHRERYKRFDYGGGVSCTQYYKGTDLPTGCGCDDW